MRGGGSSVPVQPWGRGGLTDGFDVQLNATSPAGRQQVKLQVEACPPGVAFGHGACVTQTSPAWTDVTTASVGIPLTRSLTGLNEAVLYRWRARDLALAALPMGWPLLYLRFWNAWQDAFPEGPPGGARYEKHPLDGLDEAAFVIPWAWPVSLLRHRRAILEAGRRVAQALAPVKAKAPATGARPSGAHLSGAGGEPRPQ